MAREFEKRGQFFKVDDGQGIAYGWAIVCSENGKSYVDLQGDHIPESAMLAAAEDFSKNSRVAKDMHEGEQVGDFPFIYPVTKSSKDLGIDSARTGLLVGFKPSDPALLKLIASGERTGFSIGGVLIESTDEPIGKSIAKAKGAPTGKARVFRTFKINEISLVDLPAQEGATVGYVKRAVLVRKDDTDNSDDETDDTAKCAQCDGYMKTEDTACPKCGASKRLTKGDWSTATVDDFPDSSFLYVESGGKKDADGKTTPRSLRHFPYRDENGKIDIAHLRDAIGRIPQSSLPATLRNKLQVKAEKLLAAQHQKRATLTKHAANFAGGALRVLKGAALTSEEDGHVHAIDLDDPATAWMDMYSTSWQTAEGADNGHSHSWTFDEATGAITIGADSGHTHTIDASVPPDALAAYAALDAAKDRENAAIAAEIVDEPSDGIPSLLTDEESSAKVAITIIQARSPMPISTRTAPVQHAAITTEGTMPTEHDKQIADLTKRAERAERLATLTDAQRAHHAKLPTDEAATFLAKSHTERETIVVELEKANEVVHTSKDGKVFRKSDDPRLIEMAKALDKQSDELAKARTDREVEILKARAKSEIGHIAGDDDTKVELVRWAGTDEKRIALLKAADAAMKTLAKSTGTNAGTEEPAGPLVLFTTELAEFAKTRNETVQKATAAFCATPRGIELYRATENYRLTGQA